MKDGIRFTETNSSDDSKGRTWGLEGELFWFIVGGGFAFVMILLLCFSALKMSFFTSLIYEAAGKDISKDIVAFRFRMTERFQNPISLDTLEALGIRAPFMSPRKISDSQFASIYTKGYTLT